MQAIDPNGNVHENLPPRFAAAIEQLSRDWSLMLRWGPVEEREDSAEEVAKALVADLDAQRPGEIPLKPPE